MRIKLKSAEYFREYIDRQLNRLDKFTTSLEAGKVKPERVPAIRRQVFQIKLHIFIARYSAGLEIETFAADFEDIVAEFETTWSDQGNTPMDSYNFDTYIWMLWMLSLSILLEVNRAIFKRIIAVLDKSQRKDGLFEYFASSHEPDRKLDAPLYYPKPYSGLLEAIQTSDPVHAQNKLLIFINDDWYNGMKLSYWFDNHKSEHSTFFGYWSFETAAVAKMKGIGNDLLGTSIYFPQGF